MCRGRKRLLLITLPILLVLGFVACIFRHELIGILPDDSRFGVEPRRGQYDQAEKSRDLRRDLKWMWKTQNLGGTPDASHGPNPHASTDRAINAASRVFNTVELTGKTREDVIGLLGDPKKSNDSVYNFPFWPAPKESMVYRFDCGAYGWQFNLLFDSDGRVKEVQRLWIH